MNCYCAAKALNHYQRACVYLLINASSASCFLHLKTCTQPTAVPLCEKEMKTIDILIITVCDPRVSITADLRAEERGA